MSRDRAEESRSPEERSPEQIVRSTLLTREQKIERLRQMAYDARELEVATEEGMMGAPPPDLSRIHEALRQLGADEGQGAAKQ